MRVIAGTARGVRLRVPRGTVVRPTPARVRTSVFSILGERVQGARVLDLFAGSGALGIEALSRGAQWCCFVETEPVAIEALRENLKRAAPRKKAAIVRRDAFRALTRLGRHAPFDLVFLDPPYRHFRGTSRVVGLLEELGRSPLLADDGLVVVQHDSRARLPEAIGPLRRQDIRRYGNTTVTFFSRQPAVDNAPESP